MLELILDSLHGKVSGFFHLVYPLAEIQEREETSYPVYYVSNGSYKPIDIDHFNGVGYFRRYGKTSISEIESKSPQQLYRYSYPLRFVGAAKNEILGKDDSFSGETLALSIVKEISDRNNELLKALQAKSVSIVVESYETDRKTIMESEFSGVKRTIPFEYSVVMLDINVTVDISKECIKIFCNEYCNGD